MTLPTNDDRIMAAIRAIIRAEFPRMRYLGKFEYVISSVNGESPSYTVDCSPVDSTIGLPDLSAVAIQPSVSGVTGTPTSGMICVVEFLDANPAKARITGIPSLGANPIARLGDQVQSFLPPTLPIVGTLAGSPFSGFITVVNPISGTITQGSGTTKSG
jgi:hypothetical protein